MRKPIRLASFSLVLVLALASRSAAQEAPDEETAPDTQTRAAAPAETVRAPAAGAPLSEYQHVYVQLGRAEGAGQRGVLGLPGLDAAIGGVAELLVSRAEAEAERYGVEVLHDELCGLGQVRALLPTTCDLLDGMVSASGGATGRVRLDALIAAVRADVAVLSTGILRAVLASVSGVDLEGPRLWLAFVAELIDGVRAGIDPTELVDRLFQAAIACDVRAEALDRVAECSTDDGRVAQRSLLHAAMLARGTLAGSLDADNVATFFHVAAGSPEAHRLETATARLVRTVRQLQRAIRDAADIEGEITEEARRARGLVVGRNLVRLVLDADTAARAVSSAGAPSHHRRDALRAVLDAILDVGAAGPNEALAQSLALLRVTVGYAAATPALRARAEAVLRLDAHAMAAVSTAVSLAAARDADAVRGILEQLVAPVGSWRGKREGPMVSVTGLVGVAAFRDRLLAAESLDTFGAGLHASIGLDLNLAGGSVGTFGFYVPLLDLGGIASVPFGLDTERQVGGTEQRVETEVDLLSIVSPGAYLRLGIARTPFVIGGGVSFVPNARVLRTVDLAGNDETRTLNAVRVQVFLATDVTLWAL